MNLDAAARRVVRWRESPHLFVKENFGATPDPWQADGLEALRHHKRIALSACKGPGKSTLESWAGWWFLTCYPHSKVPCTSITGPNLRDGLWSEFAKWQAKSDFLRKAFAWTQTRITCNHHPETWFASARQWARDADPQQQANTLAGIHADFLLFLIDEVSDIPDGVVQAAEGALTSGIKTMMMIAGNPTRTAGPLYRAVLKPEEGYHVIRITGDPDDPKRSPRINIDEARKAIELNGRDSYVVRVNILGLFPERQADKLLDVRDVEEAMNRSVPEIGFRAFPRILSLDPARYGDDASILTARQGPMVYPQREFRGLDTYELADQAAAALTKWDADAVLIDSIGIGAGTVDALRHRGYGDKVIPVDFGARATESDRFVNRRAEAHWHAAEAVRRSACLPRDALLAEELTAPVYSFDNKNRVWIQPKDEVKAILGRSPDRSDSLVLSYAVPVRARKREERAPYERNRDKARVSTDPFERIA